MMPNRKAIVNWRAINTCIAPECLATHIVSADNRACIRAALCSR
jgi:hypothetical protein